MKFIPEGIVRMISEKGLLASENAPRALFIGGVIGMVGSTVLACHATLKLESVLDSIEDDRKTARHTKDYVDSGDAPSGTTYSEQEYRRDLAIISTRGVGKVIKLYAPAVILGGISIAALTKSHNILQDRNLALTVAYTALDSAFNRYRERVVDRYGEDVDRELRYETEQVEILDEETGKLVKTTNIIDSPGSAYTRYFAPWSTRIWSVDVDINVMTLRTQQNWANDKLRIRGHMFLNEVYEMLGLSHSEAGAIVGWRWNKDSGDDFIDFGCWEPDGSLSDLFVDNEGEIMLDFNVDGPIYNKLDEDRTP